MSSPDQLRKQAEEAEAMARVVSYAKDKKRLEDRAAELRRQAEAQEAARRP